MDRLIRRFGKTNTQRRQYFRYREAHRDKLSGIAQSQEDRQEAQPPKNEEVPVVLTGTELGARPQSHVSGSIQPSTLVQTTASTYVKLDLDDGEKTSDADRTETSYVTSVDEQERRTIEVPPLPEIAQGGAPFECQYCFTIQSVKNPRAWKKHVFSDLEPYMCTFEDCSSQLFSSRQMWFAHELSVHRREWVCGHCSSTYESEETFTAHMNRRHQGSFTEAQLPALVQKFQRPLSKIPPSACPFCTEWEAALRQNQGPKSSVDPSDILVVEASEFCKHVATHMEELALFALPDRYDDSGSDGVRSGSIPSNEVDVQKSSMSDRTNHSPKEIVSHKAVNQVSDQEDEGLSFDGETQGLSTYRSLSDRRRSISRRNNTVQRVAVLGTVGFQPLSKASADSDSLLLAAERENWNEVQSLLVQGADPNIKRESDHCTVLHVAADQGNVDAVNLLLANGADIEIRDKHGMTPLVTATAKKHYGLVQVLVAYGADGDTALLMAVMQNHLPTVILLLEAGASLEVKDTYGMTPLQWVVRAGRVMMVEELLLRGAALDAKDKRQNTVLHHMLYLSDDSITKRLLAKAIPDLLEARNDEGRTALHVAVGLRDSSTITMLLAAGSCIDTVDSYGNVPLRYLIGPRVSQAFRSISLPADREASLVTRDGGRWRAGRPKADNAVEFVRFLLEKGANIGAKDPFGKTLVHFTAMTESPKILQLLLQNGADINTKDIDGRTPLHFAVMHGPSSHRDVEKSDIETLKELVEKGAKLNERDDEGYTPLHVAVLIGHVEAFEIILFANADPGVQDNKGRTVRDLLNNSNVTFQDHTENTEEYEKLLEMQVAMVYHERQRLSAEEEEASERSSVGGVESGEYDSHREEAEPEGHREERAEEHSGQGEEPLDEGETEEPLEEGEETAMAPSLASPAYRAHMAALKRAGVRRGRDGGYYSYREEAEAEGDQEEDEAGGYPRKAEGSLGEKDENILGEAEESLVEE
ncbi:hypothetical protein MMC30_000092 [Trapelia coarctata]|nr:hypothetical protein [Trapelia coarctata]